MTLTTVEEHNYPLLNRKHLLVKMDFPKKPTPTTATIKKEIASHVKAEENRIAIKYIDQQFGTNSALITVHVYKDEASLKRTEEIKKRKKKEGAENVKESEAKK